MDSHPIKTGHTFTLIYRSTGGPNKRLEPNRSVFVIARAFRETCSVTEPNGMIIPAMYPDCDRFLPIATVLRSRPIQHCIERTVVPRSSPPRLYSKAESGTNDLASPFSFEPISIRPQNGTILPLELKIRKLSKSRLCQVGTILSAVR